MKAKRILLSIIFACVSTIIFILLAKITMSLSFKQALLGGIIFFAVMMLLEYFFSTKILGKKS